MKYYIYKTMTGESAFYYKVGQIITSFGQYIDNTDYQNFKKQINADEAQLEDADGNLMTAEQANEFINTLPQ